MNTSGYLAGYRSKQAADVRLSKRPSGKEVASVPEFLAPDPKASKLREQLEQGKIVPRSYFDLGQMGTLYPDPADELFPDVIRRAREYREKNPDVPFKQSLVPETIFSRTPIVTEKTDPKYRAFVKGREDMIGGAAVSPSLWEGKIEPDTARMALTLANPEFTQSLKEELFHTTQPIDPEEWLARRRDPYAELGPNRALFEKLLQRPEDFLPEHAKHYLKPREMESRVRNMREAAETAGIRINTAEDAAKALQSFGFSPEGPVLPKARAGKTVDEFRRFFNKLEDEDKRKVFQQMMQTMPGLVEVPSAAQRQAISKTAEDAKLSRAEMVRLAQFAMGEAGFKGQGQQAVLHAMRNRLKHPSGGDRYGKSIMDILHKPWASEFLTSKKVQGTRHFKDIMAMPRTDKRMQEAMRNVAKVFYGMTKDPTKGATHFISGEDSKYSKGKPFVSIAGQRFFKADD
jgi:hypothetical protein